MYSNKTVLVLGATGMVGMELAMRLVEAKKYELIGEPAITVETLIDRVVKDLSQ